MMTIGEYLAYAEMEDKRCAEEKALADKHCAERKILAFLTVPVPAPVTLRFRNPYADRVENPDGSVTFYDA
jgi:hypothetical protein